MAFYNYAFSEMEKIKRIMKKNLLDLATNFDRIA
jgi:hypothetical protein